MISLMELLGKTSSFPEKSDQTGIMAKTVTERNHSISYSAVVLTNDSKNKLIDLLKSEIPEDWDIIAHHMTITLGPLLHPKGKHDFSVNYKIGDKVTLPVVSVGKSDKVIAVKVDAPYEINKDKIPYPHITIAVNRKAGGRPSDSKIIPIENFSNIPTKFSVEGVVSEIPNKENLNEIDILDQGFLRSKKVKKINKHSIKLNEDDFQTLVSKIKPDDKIIMASRDILPLDFRRTKKYFKPIGYKPNGLWYAIGTAWIDWAKDEMPYKMGEYLYRIETDDSKILKLTNKNEVYDFTKEFGVKPNKIYSSGKYSQYDDYKIDWKLVAYHYSGIEINPYDYEIKMRLMWYSTWDVASGCIWDKNVIKKAYRFK